MSEKGSGEKGTGRDGSGGAFLGSSEPPKGPSTQARELKDLLVSYARQETLEPLKIAGKNLGYGIGGAILIALGWVFALIALLRGLQMIDFFNDPSQPNGGTWSWLPYLIVVVAALFVIGLYGMFVQKRMSEDKS